MIRRAVRCVATGFALLLAGCAESPAPSQEVPSVTPVAAECPYPDSRFDCAFQRRFAEAEAYAADRPGVTAVVVRDRTTGAVWDNRHSETMVWTASTIKLAMAADLLTRTRAGEISLRAVDRENLDAMLYDSDDKAATALWMRFSGDDHTVFNGQFGTMGMTSLAPQPGFGKVYPYWGFQKCTAADLDRLLTHVLDDLHPEDRDYLVERMRAVAPNQQWGVWAAGTAMQPGVKNGWAEEEGGWVMHSIGFAGPEARYTIVVMNDLRGGGGYDEGQATVTEVARLILAQRA